MDTLVVTAVEPFGDSASVTLRSSKGELVVFCHVCDVEVGQRVPNQLSCIDEEVRSAYLSDWPDDMKAEHGAERLERIGPFSYRGCGRVINQGAGLVEVLGFVLISVTCPAWAMSSLNARGLIFNCFVGCP